MRPITGEDLGLRVLYDGTNTSSSTGVNAVDIVAVHGMGDHPDDTWCSQIDADKGLSDINWLQDPRLLPATVPHARIMRYGYDSRWFGENAIRTKTSDISQRLLFDLKEFRENEIHRPLIFIAHSYGGLVVLKTLVDAFTEQNRWPGVYNSTTGLVFFGTPFRGTHNSLSQGEILRRAYELFAENPVHGENLSILRAEGETLIDLVDNYLRIARQSRMPKVTCFYEQKASPVGAILGKNTAKEIPAVILVNESSGCLDLNASLEKYALARNHFDIHKFSNPDEQDFRIVRSAIRTMAEERPQLVHSHIKCHQTQDILDCLKSLAFPQMEDRSLDIVRATTGTCK